MKIEFRPRSVEPKKVSGKTYSDLEKGWFDKLEKGDIVGANIDGQTKDVEIISKKGLNHILVGITRSEMNPEEFAVSQEISFEDIRDLENKG